MRSSNHIKSLLKAISVLNSFSPNSLELSAAEVAEIVKIPKPTVYRLLSTLTSRGLLEQDAVRGKYRIGPVLYTLGSLYLSTTDIFKAADPVIKSLNDLTGEVISVAIFDKGYATLIMREESKYAFRWGIHIGSVFPAYASSMGKALLSELTETEIDSLFPEERLQPVTEKTIATKIELKGELKKIKKTGIAISREEHYRGVEAIASVIYGADGRAIAAMSIAVPVFKINQAYRKRLSTLVRLGTSLVSYRLGYQDMANPVRDIQEIRSWWEQNQIDLATKVKYLESDGIN